jgi:hypothetical protein
MARKSVKHLEISKSQTNVLVVIALTTALVIFCIFGTKALVVKGLYQNRVLRERRKVATHLQANVTAAHQLFNQYAVFAADDPNLLGGLKSGTGNLDGDNPKIVLDALPSKYDAPALATSVEKILTQQNIKINSLIVTDDPRGYSDSSQANPQAKAITFSFSASSSYQGMNQLTQTFERSIRPFDITNMQLGGTDNNLSITASVSTYFQPAKSLDLKPTKEVK